MDNGGKMEDTMDLASLVDAKISTIRGGMRETPRESVVTSAIRKIVVGLLDALDASALSATGGSETQNSSARSEKAILEMLNVPLIEKNKKKLKALTTLPDFTGDYFGFKRSVEHHINCRITLPKEDGVYGIHQPYGSQANPDILLIDVRDGKIVCQFGIEIKSGGPTWNTHIQFADRSMLYISIKDRIHYFFGDHIRSKESLILALAWDDIQRDLADHINKLAKEKGLKNMCVPYPKQEFRGLSLEEGREDRHKEIREWFVSSPPPSSE